MCLVVILASYNTFVSIVRLLAQSLDLSNNPVQTIDVDGTTATFSRLLSICVTFSKIGSRVRFAVKIEKSKRSKLHVIDTVVSRFLFISVYLFACLAERKGSFGKKNNFSTI